VVSKTIGEKINSQKGNNPECWLRFLSNGLGAWHQKSKGLY